MEKNTANSIIPYLATSQCHKWKICQMFSHFCLGSNLEVCSISQKTVGAYVVLHALSNWFF